MTTIEELKYEYGKGLLEAIDGAFKSYDIDFEWEAGWVDVKGKEPIKITETAGSIVICLLGINDEITYQVEDSDLEVLKKFVGEVVNNYIDKNSKSWPHDSYKVSVLNILLDQEDNQRALRFQIRLNDLRGRI